MVLAEALLEGLAVLLPLGMVERINHDFENHHFVPCDLTVLGFPQAAGGGALVCGQSAITLEKLTSRNRELVFREGLPGFVITGKKNLDETPSRGHPPNVARPKGATPPSAEPDGPAIAVV